MDFKLKPVSKLFEEIYVLDSSQSRVNQWLNIASNGKIEQINLDLTN